MTDKDSIAELTFRELELLAILAEKQREERELREKLGLPDIPAKPVTH